jgi:xanthine/uracil/vitamin C permease (AzgA family)
MGSMLTQVARRARTVGISCVFPVLKTLTGKWRDVHPLLYVVSAAFVLEFVFRPI